jgi:hypothetical protein
MKYIVSKIKPLDAIAGSYSVLRTKRTSGGDIFSVTLESRD